MVPNYGPAYCVLIVDVYELCRILPEGWRGYTLICCVMLYHVSWSRNRISLTADVRKGPEDYCQSSPSLIC